MQEKQMMTLEEKRIALQETAEIAGKRHAEARRRRINAEHEAGLAQSAEEAAYNVLAFADKQVKNFKAFYDLEA